MKWTIFLTLWCFLLQLNAQTGSLKKPEATDYNEIVLHYLERVPFAFTANANAKDAEPTGIEADIFRQYIKWLYDVKKISMRVTFKRYTDFDLFYQAVKKGQPNHVGIGNVTITEERKSEVSFSPGYLKNISVLISQGNVETLNNPEEIAKKFAKLTGLATKGSTHAKYMEELKKKYVPDLKIEYVEDQNQIPAKILAQPKYFGYVDIISYWTYLKEHSGFLKMHRVMNVDNERIGMVMPSQSAFKESLQEFFESGFGFTATKAYHEILEKYLGFEVISTVEVN